MKIKFIGCGSAFSMSNWQSNMIVEQYGEKLLIDCGTDIRYMLKENNVSPNDLDGVYISHRHADHIGGMEYLGLVNKFTPNSKKLNLYCSEMIIDDLWQGLSGGLETLQGEIATLDTWFVPNSIPVNGYFLWQDLIFRTVQTVHIMNGFRIIPSFGLMIEKDNKVLAYLTTDTQYCPNQIMDFYRMAPLIFQDCETSPFKSGVHAHYSELKNLPESIKNKMWLYHYNDGELPDAISDGFAGFVKKGQEFNLCQ